MITIIIIMKIICCLFFFAARCPSWSIMITPPYLMHMSMFATFFTAAITFLFNCGFVLVTRSYIGRADIDGDMLVRTYMTKMLLFMLMTLMILIMALMSLIRTCRPYQAEVRWDRGTLLPGSSILAESCIFIIIFIRIVILIILILFFPNQGVILQMTMVMKINVSRKSTQ